MKPRANARVATPVRNAPLTSEPRATCSRRPRPRRSKRSSAGTATDASFDAMRISVAADERTGVADAVVQELRRRGHEPLVHGALGDEERDDWAWCAEAAARDVADGRADQAVVCCWTGTGA